MLALAAAPQRAWGDIMVISCTLSFFIHDVKRVRWSVFSACSWHSSRNLNTTVFHQSVFMLIYKASFLLFQKILLPSACNLLIMTLSPPPPPQFLIQCLSLHVSLFFIITHLNECYLSLNHLWYTEILTQHLVILSLRDFTTAMLVADTQDDAWTRRGWPHLFVSRTETPLWKLNSILYPV